VRRYHQEYYRPSNLFLIVTGSVHLEALLAAVGTYDAAYAAAPAKTNGQEAPLRPFSTPVPEMPAPPPWHLTWTPPVAEEEEEEEEEASGEEEETKGEAETSAEGEAAAAAVALHHMGVQEVAVLFPSEDESCGTVVLGWRTDPFGPELPLQVGGP
jgi:hypothetical protein